MTGPQDHAASADEPDDTVIVRPDDTVVVRAEDTVVVRPDDTVVVRPDDTVIVRPDDTVVAGPEAAVASRRSRRSRNSVLPAGVLRPAEGSRGASVTLPEWIDPAPGAANGPGPGTVSSYAPRPIPPPPEPEAVSSSAGDPTRAEAPHMPSVRRASRRRSRLVLASVTLACAVSAAGLWVIALVAIGG